MDGDKSDGTHQDIREDGSREGGRHRYRRKEESDEAGEADNDENVMSSTSYVPRVAFSEVFSDNGWQSRTTRNNSELRVGGHDPRLEDNRGTEYFRRISVICMNDVWGLSVRELNQRFQYDR